MWGPAAAAAAPVFACVVCVFSCVVGGGDRNNAFGLPLVSLPRALSVVVIIVVIIVVVVVGSAVIPRACARARVCVCVRVFPPRVVVLFLFLVCFLRAAGFAFRCFDDALMVAVADAADRCAIGTFFITFTKEVPSRKWLVRAWRSSSCARALLLWCCAGGRRCP